MKNFKYSKKIVALTITSIAIATPLVIAKINSKQIDKLSISSNLDNQLYSFNKESNKIINLTKNQNQLLNEIGNKYDENQEIFKSFKKEKKHSFKFLLDVKNETNKQIVFNDVRQQISAASNNGHYQKWNGVTEEEAYNSLNNQTTGDFYFSFKNDKLIINPTIVNFIASTKSYGSIKRMETKPGNSGYPELVTYWENISTSINFRENNYPLTEIELNNINKFIYKINEDSLPNLNIDSKSLHILSGKFDFAKGVIKIVPYDLNKNFVTFKGKELEWNNFFLIKPSNIEKDKNYYLGTNRPTIEFGLNLPLVNSINWYGKIPEKFIELRNLIKNVENTWNDNKHLFNEIFNSKENFYNFFNNYLLNFANFYYDEITYNNLVQFIKDLNISEPSIEIRNAVIELINTNKEVQYKNIIIPANIRNTKGDTTISGSYYNINLLNSLNINALNFIENQNIGSNSIWSISKFENIETINEWNAYNDVILPIILSQKIFVEYEDAYNNKSVVEVYNGREFIKEAIKPAAITGDFDSPYSSVKIKNISIGNFETKPYLGTNTDVNSKSEFETFVNQSKINATKTINGKEYASEKGFNDPIYMQALSDGIEIKFRYIANEKPVEESAWSDIKGDNEITPFMLIPDEAWGEGESFDTNPNSSLEEILGDIKSKELFERAVARPFIMKKNITTQDLKEAKKKYVNVPNQNLLIFTKQDIKNFFLNDKFTNKYNELSSKPWWTWTFAELVQEENNFNNGVSGSFNVVQDNSLQDQWFKNFISNTNLANKSLQNFFPKYNEGRFFVFSPYKPSIDSTQVKLKEEAGFFYAGEQKDAYNMITNFNYVVELEVKNKTYTSKLNELNIASNDYKGQNLSFRKYQQLMNSLTKEWVNYFAIDNSRFKAEQIKDPNIEYIYVPSDDPFIQTTYGYIKIDYQNSIPVVNQIGNDVVYEQLPFDLNKIIGFTEFRHKYNKYIIESKEEWDKLSQFEQSKVILIDSQNNEILIGGHVIAQEQNFKVQGAPRIIIPDEYVDPSLKDNPYFGFNQKTKEYVSLEELRNKWNSYSQDELFDILFGRYNHKNQAKLLKERIKQFGVTLYVRIDDEYKLYWGYYWYEDGEKLGDETFDYVQLTKIEVVRTDLIDLSKFNYGYNREKDTTISFGLLVTNIKNKEKLAQHFNLDEFQLKNFINGIKSIEIIEQNQQNNLIKIQITLNENYVLYNENDPFIISINARELIKFEFGSLLLNNFSKEIKEELVKRNNEEKIQYLNSLDLEIKKSLFKTPEKKSIITNNFINMLNFEQIQDITFNFNNDDLIADIKFYDSNLVLDAKASTKLTNFDYNLKVDLGLIDPFKQKVLPWTIGGIVSGGVLLIALVAFIWYRRHRQKEQLLKTPSNTTVLTEADLFNDNNENSSEKINKLDNDNNIENSL